MSAVSTAYARRLNEEFKIFGASGRSVFFGAGDSGKYNHIHLLYFESIANASVFLLVVDILTTSPW